MSLRSRIRTWGRAVFRSSEMSRQVQEELAFHIESYAAELEQRGMAHDEALRKARAELGSVAARGEDCRRAWGARFFDELLGDLRYALRMLRKSPGFAAVAVGSLALGIGANTAIFSVMHAVLLRMLPVRDPQQLFYLTHASGPPDISATGDYKLTFGINVYQRLRADRAVFSDVVAYIPLALTKTAVRAGDTPEEVRADEVSGSFFSALGVGMAAGQAFVAADEEKHSPVAVLSYGYWTRRFHRDPAVVGQTIYVNGVPLTVVGVSGQGFYGVESGGDAADLWVPLQNRTELNAWGVPQTAHTLYGNPNWWCAMLIARLRPNVSEKRALARMDPLFAHAAWETQGKEKYDGQPLGLTMVPARGLGLAASDYEQPMKVLMGMVALVLAIVCVNLLMLQGARNAAREREFSMRLALGASRKALLRQLMVESVVLVSAGAAAGWWFAGAATKLLARWAEMEVSLAPDAAVLTYTVAISAGAALLFGLWPLRAAGNAPISLALRASAHHSTESRGRVVTGKVMVVAQMATCMALLFGAGLLVRTLGKYQHVDLGMQADQVLAFGAHPTGTHDNAQMAAFYRALTERISALPGVRSVTVAEMRPGSGWVDNNMLVLDGRSYSFDNGRNMLYTNSVGPGFFETLGIPVLAGRGITAADTQGAPGVVVVNETFARRYLNGGSPIGHKLGKSMTIVGLVRDNKYQSADEGARPMAWWAYEQNPTIPNMDVEVRAEGDPRSLVPEIRRIVRQMDANAPLGNPMVLKTQFAETYLMPALFARLGGFFGGLAALLVAVGLYGTLAYRVSRRTVEIGVRMALGAARGRVVWMILRESLALVAMGLAIGLPLAWFGSKWMTSMLYQVSAHDPVSFGLAVVGVLVVSIAAAVAPARRAAGVDPMRALRQE